jgi:endogenous inhibitor of DNA gyrase (YacG/DUF329 family)
MKITYDASKQKIDTGKKIYTCSTCDNLFNWGKDSTWYGSYKMMEDQPHKIKYFCSSKCKTKP